MAATSIPERTSDSTPIDRFQGRYAFLSNFYLCVVRIAPCDMLLDPSDPDQDAYPSAEHAFQAAKTHDPEQRRRIREVSLPSKAKALGGRRGIATLRPDWERVKEEVMLRVLRAKFFDRKLAAQILATDDRPLIEGNTWGDVEWGVYQGRGQNKLGKALEIVRAEIRARGRPIEGEE